MADDDWSGEGDEADLADLFPGFESRWLRGAAGRIFARVGGEGTPLVCLHGFPQSHVMWHRIAPALARHFTVVAMDLRGYGWSTAPAGDARHETYAKRAMAEDVVAVMSELGHARFSCLAHDRGARVAYRMALDAPGRLVRLVMLDIVPTVAMWRRIEDDASFADKVKHWHWLSRPAPGPEDAILADPTRHLEGWLAAWSGSGLGAFDGAALEHYRRAIAVPERAHAMCEDYRAGATRDREADEADLTAGRRIDCPVRVIWGEGGTAGSAIPTLEAWRPFADDLAGEAIAAGHFLPEEAPDATLEALARAFDMPALGRG